LVRKEGGCGCEATVAVEHCRQVEKGQ
jgi:hypothetical protein